MPAGPIAWQTDELTSRVARILGSLRPLSSPVLGGTLVFVGASATAALVLGPFGSPFEPAPDGTPFVNAAGAGLLAYLVGLAAIVLLSDRPDLRRPLTALGLFVVAWACPSELDGLPLVLVWAALMVLGLGIWYRLVDRSSVARATASGQVDAERLLALAIPGVALAAGVLAGLHVMGTELPLSRFGEVVPPGIPFSDAGAAAAGILVLATLLGGALAGPGRDRRVAIVVAAAMVMYAIPYEVYAWAVVILWCGLGVGALGIVRFDPAGRITYLASAVFAIAAAAATAVWIAAPPARLVVSAAGVEPVVALQSAAALGVVAPGVRAARPIRAAEPLGTAGMAARRGPPWSTCCRSPPWT